MGIASWVDTHGHLTDEAFADDVAGVLARAQAAGVSRLLSIGTTLGSSRACLELAERTPGVWASVGIHPNHAAEAQTDDWAHIVALADHPKAAAIGETGLDRHWDFTPFPVQEDYFARHLWLARKVHKPIVIHCREAEADILRMLTADHQTHGPILGVMHSFTGGLSLAEAALRLGLYVSFAGMLTYKSAADLREVAARLPRDRVLLETDCPYLVPVPLRGAVKRNEPAHLIHTAACLASLWHMTPEAVAEQTTANACRLFRLP